MFHGTRMGTRARTIGAAALVAATVASTAIPAAARDGDIEQRGTCTGRSRSELKLGHRDGGIEVEWEVDSNKARQQWTVTIKANRATVYAGPARTTGRSGSFSIERRARNRKGLDRFSARATNNASGERCSATASI